jgi:hypothetical protein
MNMETKVTRPTETDTEVRRLVAVHGEVGSLESRAWTLCVALPFEVRAEPKPAGGGLSPDVQDERS